MIQTRGIVKIQETEMMVDRVRIKGEFVFQGLYGTNDTSAYLESLEYSLPFEEYVHIEGVLPSDYVKVKYTIDDINTIFDQFKENKHSCIIDFFLSDHGRNERKRNH